MGKNTVYKSPVTNRTILSSIIFSQRGVFTIGSISKAYKKKQGYLFVSLLGGIPQVLNELAETNFIYRVGDRYSLSQKALGLESR